MVPARKAVGDTQKPRSSRRHPGQPRLGSGLRRARDWLGDQAPKQARFQMTKYGVPPEVTSIAVAVHEDRS